MIIERESKQALLICSNLVSLRAVRYPKQKNIVHRISKLAEIQTSPKFRAIAALFVTII